MRRQSQAYELLYISCCCHISMYDIYGYDIIIIIATIRCSYAIIFNSWAKLAIWCHITTLIG